MQTIKPNPDLYNKCDTYNFPVDPPIPGQVACIVSFMLPPVGEPRKKIAGFFKFRGVYPSNEQAELKAEELTKGQDNYHDEACLIFSAGHWIPITDDFETFSKEVKEIDTMKKEEFKDEMVSKMTDLREAQREKIDKQIQEVHDRQQKLREDVRPRTRGELKKETWSLERYCELRMKEHSLNSQIERNTDFMRDMTNGLVETRRIIKKMDKKNPEYKNQFVEKIRKAQEDAGIPVTGRFPEMKR